MIEFDPSSIAFAVITYYPKWYQGKLRSIKHTDKVRGDLALEFFRKATQGGYKVVVADGKSSKTFKKTASIIPNLIFIKRKTHNPSQSKRETIKKTAKLQAIKAIIITEPEKVSLLDSVEKIVKPILKGEAEIVVLKRNQDLFLKTYPSYMYESELEGNKLYNEILRTHALLKEREYLDMFFGPRAFSTNPKVLRLFTRPYHLKLAKNLYLGTNINFRVYSVPQYLPIVEALRKKMKVRSVEVEFSYPALQKENEEKGQKSLFEEKRAYQRMSALLDLIYFLNPPRRP